MAAGRSVSLGHNRVVFLIAIALLGGCRFKSPGVAEQQELARRGSLGRGAPGWMAVSNRGVASVGAASSGFLPETYSANVPGTTVSPVYSTISDDDRLRAEQNKKVLEAAAQKAQVAKEGPLDRIAKACPGTEKEVNEALTTTDGAARMEKYKILTERCPNSADLWTWAGKTYLTQGRLNDAGRAFDQAVGLDPQNTEASDLAAEVRKQQAKAKAAKKPAEENK